MLFSNWSAHWIAVSSNSKWFLLQRCLTVIAVIPFYAKGSNRRQFNATRSVGNVWGRQEPLWHDMGNVTEKPRISRHLHPEMQDSSTKWSNLLLTRMVSIEFRISSKIALMALFTAAPRCPAVWSQDETESVALLSHIFLIKMLMCFTSLQLWDYSEISSIHGLLWFTEFQWLKNKTIKNSPSKLVSWFHIFMMPIWRCCACWRVGDCLAGVSRAQGCGLGDLLRYPSSILVARLVYCRLLQYNLLFQDNESNIMK